MHALPGGVAPGRSVTARGSTWTVVGTAAAEDCAIVTLEGREPDNRGQRLRLLTPFDDVRPLPDRRRLRRARREQVAAAVISAVTATRPAAGLWSLASARIEALPWQIQPALTIVDGITTRVLLADAVGLGKTIEAGLVLAELLARGWIERALILTPPGLRDGWAHELRSRFDLRAAIADHDWLDGRMALSIEGANPWAGASILVSSIDLVKRLDVRASLAALPIDLLIVDEAHHVTPGTDRGTLVASLASRALFVVLASATPHSGSSRAFTFLLELGQISPPGPPMAVFRRDRRQLGLPSDRRQHVLAVTPTAAESQLHQSIHAYTTAMRKGPCAEVPGVRLIASVIARRATSTAVSVERTLRRRLALILDPLTPAPLEQPRLPWDESDDDEDAVAPWVGLPALPDRVHEAAWLEQLIALAAEARTRPSKLARLERLLRCAGEPAIVFTEFRDSLDACLPALEAVGRVACLHGGLSPADRRAIVSDFDQGCVDVLLATDVAGEGLNLHRRCRLVVMIEWPWSPQRVEQRIGRVDRFGQTRRVHAVQLTARGSFEETVVAALLTKAARAARDLGRTAAPALAAGDVEAAVFDEAVRGEPVPEASASPVGRGFSPGTPRTAFVESTPRLDQPADRALVEVHRANDCRRLAQRLRRGRGARGGWALPARGSSGSRVAVVFEVSRIARDGRPIAAIVVPIETRLRDRPARREGWRRVCQALAADPRLRLAAADAAPEFPPIAAVLRERAEAIRGSIARQHPAERQSSLFEYAGQPDTADPGQVRRSLEGWLTLIGDRFTATPNVEVTTLAVLPLR